MKPTTTGGAPIPRIDEADHDTPTGGNTLNRGNPMEMLRQRLNTVAMPETASESRSHLYDLGVNAAPEAEMTVQYLPRLFSFHLCKMKLPACHPARELPCTICYSIARDDQRCFVLSYWLPNWASVFPASGKNRDWPNLSTPYLPITCCVSGATMKSEKALAPSTLILTLGNLSGLILMTW